MQIRIRDLFDPGSGMEKNSDLGWKKIRIRDKHPGSATLVVKWSEVLWRHHKCRDVIRVCDIMTNVLTSSCGLLLRRFSSSVTERTWLLRGGGGGQLGGGELTHPSRDPVAKVLKLIFFFGCGGLFTTEGISTFFGAKSWPWVSATSILWAFLIV